MRITGLILIVLGLLALLGLMAGDRQERKDNAGPGTVAVLMLGGGVALVVVATRRRKVRRHAETLALQMLHDAAQIDILRFAQVVRMDPGDAKRLILELQREGVVPYDARIL